ncbi:MAG: outer membrane beta-barrel protein [Gemmatimonadaceae bacterium]|nr:outer membrane beta-barrel protein [Gemmatimonadaceae bacterium]
MAPSLILRRVIVGTACVIAPLAATAQATSGDGFLFGAPRASITLRGGFASPSASGDVFSFVQNELTLGRHDFAGGSMAADLALHVRPRVAIQMGIGYSGRTTPSVYRGWVDNQDREIEQRTTFQRLPLTLGVRYYLASPGRALGQLAWVPSRFTPYIGAGGGITWSRFRQTGDFVDYQTLDVFPATLESSAWAPTLYGVVGVEHTLNARLGLTGEARYDHGRARVSSDFSGFNGIDLSGLTLSVGLTMRF